MKSKLLICFLFFTIAGYSQYPCFNGISTNPLNPINNQLVSKRNTFFNWQDSIWAQRIYTSCGRDSAFQESPFFKTSNLEELRQAKDMKWDDGWELVKREFGLTDQNTYTTDPVPHVSTILYNKYTGILRVLLKVCNGADYNAAKIVLQFDGTSAMKTDLFEYARTEVTPINKKFSEVKFESVVSYTNDKTKWFYADFPMMYDPCTCNYSSKLKVLSHLISNASINLEGSITGDIHTKDVGGKAQVQKPGSFGWKELGGLINGKVSTVHGSIDKFLAESQKLAENIGRIDTINKKQSIDNLAFFLKNNQWLKSGLNSVPWLKTAVGIFDAFSGGGKTTSGPTEVKLLPLSVNLTAKISGSLTLANPYHSVILTNPGSKDAQLDPGNYPYYNEVLGVFNLIQSPIMYNEKVIGDITDYGGTEYGVNVISNKYHFLLDSLKYVLNQAAGVTIQNMQVAMVFEAVPNNAGICSNSQTDRYMPGFIFEGRDGITNAYKFRTDYYDVKCFNENTFQAVSYFGRSTPNSGPFEAGCWIPQPKAYLKFMINLRRNVTSSTTQNILYVATYPMKIKNYDITNNYVDQPCNDSTIVAPATVSEVNSLCNSSVYFNLDRQAVPNPDSSQGIVNSYESGIVLFPNPNTGRFTIKIQKSKSHLRSFKILGIDGKTYHNENLGNVSLDVPFIKQMNLQLKSGMYILQFQTDKKTINTKLVIVN